MEHELLNELPVAELAGDAQRPCLACAAADHAPAPHVYALGKVEARFPNSSLEKEFAQCTGRADTVRLSDHEAFYSVVAKKENRYLVREMCWVFRIQGIETYLLQPRDPADFDLLVEAIRPRPSPMDIDAVIGVRGPVAPPEFCGGLTVPFVRFDQFYSFDADALVRAIPRSPETADATFEPIAQEVFYRIMQMADNAGATDEHRALNYLAMRCHSIYAQAAEQFAKDFALVSVEARAPSLGDLQKVIDVIFTYVNRKTDFTEKFAVRVQMGKYPSLVRKLSPYLHQ